MSASGDDYLWSNPTPARQVAAALPAIAEWCRARRVGRPMLVGGPTLSAPRGLALVHGLEAAGLAVWAFDRAVAPALAVVADAVAGYHFEGCDAVVAVGGGTAAEVAKAAALMLGQRQPYHALAPEPGTAAEALDVSAVPPLLSVPSTPVAAATACGALWIADEAGVARPLRHPALRPGEAILAGDQVGAVTQRAAERSLAVLVLLGADAGVAEADLTGLLALETPGEAVRAALRLAAILEGSASPRRRLALTAAVTSGGDFGHALLALSEPAAWSPEVRRRLGADTAGPLDVSAMRAARALCHGADAAAVDAVLAAAGIEFAAPSRRRGRRERSA